MLLSEWIGDKTDLIRAYVLTDFPLTAKAATLIFIYGRGSAISSAKQGISDSRIW